MYALEQSKLSEYGSIKFHKVKKGSV